MKLEIGANTRFEIREVQCPGISKKRITLMYLSDFHFRAGSEKMALLLVATIESKQPDIVLLGGDYADTKAGQKHLQTFLTALAGRFHVLAIAGNHDRWKGIEKTSSLMRAHGVQWIEGTSSEIVLGGQKIRIDGNVFLPPAMDVDIYISCLHIPVSLPTGNDHYQLVLAGHLHGGQMVWWQTANGMYPGKWLYKWNILQKRSGNCLHVVSKGLGDTLPIRYNCPKDLLFLNF